MEGEDDRSKPGKVPFWRKEGNAAKHGARLGGWRAAESEGDDSEIPCVTDGTKGCTAVVTLRGYSHLWR